MKKILVDATQHAHPADRFAREILAFLECDSSRSQRLMRNPLGRLQPSLPNPLQLWCSRVDREVVLQ